MKMEKIIKKIQIYLLFLIITIIKTDGDDCTLTRKPRADPFPSLLKCYKYNNDACCLSVHDEYIDTVINQILSVPCIRKYPLFEILMCFGCHPNEKKYINITDNGKTKNIRICRSFANEFWGGDLDSPTTIFDQCGFKVETKELTKSKFGNLTYLIPSEAFKNFYDFFKYIKIPFYEEYNITIQNETNDYCYNNNLNLDYKFCNSIYFLFLLLFLLK